MKRALEYVVDSCVNAVGVNVNTGSAYLLAHVSGIGDGLAKSIVEYREKHGLFKTRDALMEVSRFSKKTFEQAAGFLRIPESANPLDNTGVHPEKYADLEAIAKSQNKTIQDFIGQGARQLLKMAEAKEKLGEFTLKDIAADLERPGRDPRDTFVPVQFREDLTELKDVQPGMICPGVVTNVTNFGAFVDIGVHQDGLVHISQLTNKFVTDPAQVVSPGDKVTVKVLEVNLEKTQMALTMRFDEKPTRAPQPPAEAKKLHVSYSGDQAAAIAQSKRAPTPTPISERRPSVQARPTPSPAGSSRPMPTPNSGKGKPAAGPKPIQAFNNPFAGLASLKDALKK